MKNKMLKLLCIALMAVLLSACEKKDSKVSQVIQQQMQQEDAEANVDATSDIETTEEIDSDEKDVVYNKEEGIDVDLTQLSSTMIYSEVYNMMCSPDSYIGKTVKMTGAFSLFENTETGQQYLACIIKDATACCAQGIEFELEEGYSNPKDYLALGDDITVKGEFETYEEDGYLYCRLKDAVLE